MSKVISKILKIKTEKFPPEVDFIEQEIEKNGIEPLRWAIIDRKNDELIISASGRELIGNR